MMNACFSPSMYASNTPGRSAGETTFLRYAAPALMTVSGLTSGAYLGRLDFRPLEKMFCAIEMAMAPPRELKKMAMAFPVGLGHGESVNA